MTADSQESEALIKKKDAKSAHLPDVPRPHVKIHKSSPACGRKERGGVELGANGVTSGEAA